MNNKAPTFVFVVGCQRSGTTLTGQILGAHPNAVLLDEPDGIYPWFEDLDPARPMARPGLSKVFAKAAEKYADPEQRFETLPNGQVWIAPSVTHIVLKAPNLTYYGPKIAQMRARKSIVSIIRDPRDVVASMEKLSHIQMVRNQLALIRSRPDLPDWVGAEAQRLADDTLPMNDKRAIVWAIKNRLCDEMQVEARHYLRIVYEELVASPESVLPLVCNHVQFEDHPSLRRHEALFVGVGPGKTSRTRGIDTASLGKSKQGLAEDERSRILSIAGPLAARYRRAGPVDLDRAQAPLVLLGRGGSGTRLLAQVFLDAGVFLGNKLNYSNDSMEWVDTVYGAVSTKLARTGDPEDLSVPEIRQALCDTACKVFDRSNIENFASVIWGWKLPESMILVPEVLEAFPQAKIVQIVRHPVTSSLRRTHKTSRNDDEVGRYVLRVARDRVSVPETHNLDEDALNNALSWYLQVGSVTQICRKHLPADRYLEIRYEDMFNDWAGVLARLAAFTGLPAERFVQPPLDETRRRSFSLPDPRIEEVWNMTKDVAEVLGYGLDSDGAPCEVPLT